MPDDKTTETLLSLHAEIAKQLAQRIQAGEATAAEFMAAIRFLKDNNISAARVPGNPLDNLANLVPFPTAEDRENSFPN